MEIIISDRASAYGIYIRALLDRKKTAYIKAHDLKRYKKHASPSLLIFVISELNHIYFLQKLLDTHFDKAIICYDVLSIPDLSISKPHVYISLNKLRTKWMEEILNAIVTLKGKEAEILLNKKNNAVLNFISAHLNT